MSYEIREGDSYDLIRELEDESIHAIVTDPPYGLSNQPHASVVECLKSWLAGNSYEHGKKGFMGKGWDGWVPDPAIFKECYRVLKPGGHMVVFTGSRTMDLMGLSIRLGVPEGEKGWEPVPAFAWIYGQGAGLSHIWSEPSEKQRETNPALTAEDEIMVEAKWEGWSRGWLKPAYEPILVFRKPYDGPIYRSVLKHGTGAVNIDACRIPPGRFPSTVLLGHSPECDEECVEGCPIKSLQDKTDHTGSSVQKGLKEIKRDENYHKEKDQKVAYGKGLGFGSVTSFSYGDTGAADRFFSQFQHESDPFLYCAKASTEEREIGVVGEKRRGNSHPTVKPIELMRWLVRLICPNQGVLLDPFSGSGTTIIASILEDISHSIGFEMDPEYVNIATQRCEFWGKYRDSSPKAWKEQEKEEDKPSILELL